MRRIKPDKMNTIVAMLCLALLGIFAGGVAGLCLPEHPQSSVCRSKFVVRAKVLNFHMKAGPAISKGYRIQPRAPAGLGLRPSGSRRNPFLPVFVRVELQKLIKGRKYLPSKRGHQFDIQYTSMSLPKYQVGKSYLLTGFATGMQLATNECSWFSEWDKLTPVMNHGLRRYYWMYCGCQIRRCFRDNCPKLQRKCTWQVGTKGSFEKNDFLSKNRVCMVKCGKCDWFHPTKHQQCFRG